MSQKNIGLNKQMHSFAMVPEVHKARSMFDRSHAVKDTFDFDYLTPIYIIRMPVGREERIFD